jgi:hypothetical protein
MMVLRIALSAFTVASNPCFAADCVSDLHKTQAFLDRFIERQARVGAFGKQATFATLGRQPSPASMARAERDLGEGGQFHAALSHLRMARAYASNGDETAYVGQVAAAHECLHRSLGDIPAPSARRFKSP